MNEVKHTPKKTNIFANLAEDSDNDNNSSSNDINHNNNHHNNHNNHNNGDNNHNDNNINNIIRNIEDNILKVYYNKKHLKQNKSRINNEGYTTIAPIKKKVITECSTIDLPENLFDLKLENNYRILAHHNDDKNWDYISYHNITTITTWKELPQFFNTLNNTSGECKYTDFDIFIMKNEISPMWEDIENRNGSICSIKIDSITDGYELLKKLCYHMINNSLLKFTPNLWDIVNGLSFSPKKIDNFNLDSYCVIIKIWFKINILNYGNIDKLFIDDISNIINKYSIKVKSIKPEY